MSKENSSDQSSLSNNPETVSQFSEIKERLHNHLGEVIDGYGEFAEVLGEKVVSDTDFETTLESKSKQWASDGSFAYLQEWSEQNPDHKIYMSASPNKIIPREKIFKVAVKLGEKLPRGTFIGKHLDDPEHDDEVFCDVPQLGPNGEILPVSLTIWTNTANLSRGTLFEQQQKLASAQQIAKSATDPSILQGIAHMYRLLHSSDFDGSLTSENVYGATIIRRISVSPRISGAGLSGQRTPGLFINPRKGYKITIREFRADEKTVSHFVIGDLLVFCI